MREWKKLKTLGQKFRRVWFTVGRFLRNRVWGHYRDAGLVGLYHWVRCHVWNRYHIVNLSKAETGPDGYRWGWLDRDHAMYLACFRLLMEFVEGEDPRIGLRTEADYGEAEGDPYWKEQVKSQLERGIEIRTLYDWWTKGRAEEHAEHARQFALIPVRKLTSLMQLHDTTSPEWRSWSDRESELQLKDDEMLMRLLKIRRCLWT